MLVMACAVTGTVNCQIIERKDTASVLDGLNRFFHEVCVPKICYPDKDGALMKALQDGEVNVQDMQGRLHKERGLYFETCLPQGHYQHGRIERKIRQLQDSLDRSDIRKSRVTATGWQTIAKAIEHEVNSVPLGFLYHQGNANPLLRVLCPNLLKNGTFSNRAPKGLFSIPNSVEDLMSNVENTYNLWFQVWNTEYLPLVMDRPKWHLEDENLQEQDLIYFKLTDSKLAADWKLGKVEYVNVGRDGKVRSVGISHKIMIEHDNKVYHEDLDWKHSVVERPVRAVVKLMNIEDTSLLENITQVQDLVKKILEGNQPYSDSKDEEIFDADGQEADDARKDTKSRRKRKTELERLLEDKEKMFHSVEKSNVIVSSADVYSATWSNSREKAKYFAPTIKEDISAKYYNEVTESFTVSPVKCSTQTIYNWKNLNISLHLPSSITKEDDIGLTTLAIQAGVTKMIADGVKVVKQHGHEGKGDGQTVETESSNESNSHDLFLL